MTYGVFYLFAPDLTNQYAPTRPRAGSAASCALDSIFDFGAISILCLFISHASPLVLFHSPFSLLISSLTDLFL